MFEKWDKLHLQRAFKDGGAEARRHFAKDILPMFGDLPADALTRAHVARVVDAALERNAPRSALMVLTFLRQLCRWGMSRGYLETDPTGAFRKASIPINGPRERVLSDAELRELARRLPEAGLPLWAPPAVGLLLATAARVGELLRARWDDFDPERREWTIPAENTQNGRAARYRLVRLRPGPARGPGGDPRGALAGSRPVCRGPGQREGLGPPCEESATPRGDRPPRRKP